MANTLVQANINAIMEKWFFPRLRSLSDMPDASTTDMYDVADYLFWAY